VSLKYEAALNEIALNQLKSQLNPHFIFNALNGIRALIEDEPVKAKKAITQLSTILRNSLVTDKKRLTGFDEELNTVKDYLGLESIRYEERLQTFFDIDPDSSKFSVPPLMLQTLIENGIKHGISTLKKGGMIKLTTVVKDSKLVIRIRNSGQYLNGETVRRKEGYGISNTLQRLNLIYGNEATFKIENENQNTVLTEIILPLNI
jgi:LytS/YehU family sensor histidine kinase